MTMLTHSIAVALLERILVKLVGVSHKLGLLPPPQAGERWGGGELKCSITLRTPSPSLPRKRGRGPCGPPHRNSARDGFASTEKAPGVTPRNKPRRSPRASVSRRHW